VRRERVGLQIRDEGVDNWTEFTHVFDFDFDFDFDVLSGSE
jgi:hypothetical protein